jgi:DNA-binding response OmpR family regulator
VTVLVADDDASVRSFFRLVLTGAGYEVLDAANGREADHIIHTQKVDLLITDLVMPEQEGIETILALRRSKAGLKIIAISGAFEGRYLNAAASLGADATLLKPVSPADLLSTVSTVLAV